MILGGGPGFSLGGPASGSESRQCSGADSSEQSELSVTAFSGAFKGPGSFWVFNTQI